MIPLTELPVPSAQPAASVQSFKVTELSQTVSASGLDICKHAD